MSGRLNRWGLIIPWAIFVLMGAGWTATWFALSGDALRQLERARAGLPDGSRIAYERAEAQGFPLHLTITLTEPAWTAAGGGISATAPSAVLAVNVLNQNQRLLFPQGPVRLDALGKSWTITAARIEMSARSGNETGLKEARLVLTDARIVDGSGAATVAKLLAFAVRPDPKTADALQLAVTAENVTPAPMVGFEGIGPGPVSGKAGIVIEKASDLVAGPDPLPAWSTSGGKLGLEAFEARWGEIHATADGEIAFDDARRPTGRIAVTFDEPAQGLRAIAGNARLAPADKRAADALQAGQGLVGGGAGLTLTAQDGRWTLGAVDLGPADPIY